MINRIDDRLAKRNGQSNQLGPIAQAHLAHNFFEAPDQRRDQRFVVRERESEPCFFKAFDDTLLSRIGCGHRDDLADDVGEVLTEVPLRHVTGRPGAEGSRRDLLATVRGDEYDRNGRMFALHRLDQRLAVHPGHLQVSHDEIGKPLMQRREGLDAVDCHVDVKPGIFQQETDLCGLRRTVFDDEHACHVHASVGMCFQFTQGPDLNNGRSFRSRGCHSPGIRRHQQSFRLSFE